MISIEEKEQLIKEIKNKARNIARKGIEDDNYIDATYDIMQALKPLLEEYNKGIMEVINPINNLVLPILVYLFKSTAASLENELKNHEDSAMLQTLLEQIENSYTSISFNRPC